MNRNERMAYVEQVLDFHFDGKFTDTMESGSFCDEEINQWVSMAYLYERCLEQGYFKKDQNEDAFSMIEDLYTSASVDLSMGFDLDELDLEEVGGGYDFNRADYRRMLDYVIDLIRQHGVQLWRLIV